MNVYKKNTIALIKTQVKLNTSMSILFYTKTNARY